MSREIKFRAWDEEVGEICYPYIIDFNIEWAYYVDDKEVVERAKTNTLMQYTGLKDKDGVDIYEGDILSFTEVDKDSCMEAEETHVGEIKWINSCAQFRFIYQSGQRRELFTIVDFCCVYDVKVIGNIYENPELLEEK